MAGGAKCIGPFKPVPSSLISAAVGFGKSNNKNDVKMVQQLLNAVAVFDGGPAVKLKEDGIVGPKTNAAIITFQRKIMGGFADGIVDSGGKTARALKDNVLKKADIGKVGEKSSFPEDRLGGGAVPEALGMIKMLQPRLLNLSFKISRQSDAVLALMAKHFTNPPGEALDSNDIDLVQTVLRDMRVFMDRANAFGEIQAGNVILFFDAPGLLGFTVRGGDKMTVDDLQVYADKDGNAFNYPGQSIFITGAWKATNVVEKMLTLIHEFCHFVGDRDDPPPPLPPNPNKVDDHAYVDDPAMQNLVKPRKLRNAESLALFFLEFCIGTAPLFTLNPNANVAMMNRAPFVDSNGDIVRS